MAITRLLQLDESLSGALLLLGTASGAPFLPLLAGIAKGDLAVGYMPSVLPLLLSGVSVDPGKIASSLLLLMLLPLGIGLAVKSGLESIANRIEPLFSNVSKFALVLLILLMFVANIQKILSLYGSPGVLASILLLVAGSMMGWLLGGPAVETRSVMALGTAQRNIAAALVVAKQNFSDPRGGRDGSCDCDRWPRSPLSFCTLVSEAQRGAARSTGPASKLPSLEGA
jgi:BASS family bile acid:Na+ symporter